MKLTKLTGTLAAALLLTLAAAPQNAAAGAIQVSTAACGGFSSCNDTTFVTAAGVPLTFEDFLLNVADGTAVNGGVFSSDFVLSSEVGAFGGVNSADVLHALGVSGSSEVGPVSAYNGTLAINFAAAQSAVGFGTVQFGDNGTTLEVIRVYNGATLLGTFDAISTNFFNYEGFVATGGDVITRVELDGGFFAIQNMKYTNVPEPVSLSLLGLGLAGFAVRRRPRR